MAQLSSDQIIKAGRILKVIQLAGHPGMDSVAIKLNSGLTYHEEQIARRWARAFELAQTDETITDCAIKLHGEFR